MAPTNAQVFHGRQMEALRRQLGNDVLEYLEDPAIVEVMLNPDGYLWVDTLGRGMDRRCEMDPVRAQMVMDTVAAMLGTVITTQNPILECELPLDGSRFEGLIPPLVDRPVFTIRKRALLIFTLADYVRQGVMSEPQADTLRTAISRRANILVAGGTGSGKTTLANALLQTMGELAPDHRLVIIEDTRELQCAAPNVVFLKTSEGIDMTRLLRATLRMRPDRIVVGEVRGAEALALLKAWNTGHPGGVGTVHANDAESALIRIGQLIQEAHVPPNPELIAEAVNMVVSIKRTAAGRRVESILKVTGYQDGAYQLERDGAHGAL